MKQRVFVSADHGLAIVYFLQTEVLQAMLDDGVEVVLLTDEGIKEQIEKRFGRPGLIIESLRMKQCREFMDSRHYFWQYWTHFLRWMGGSSRINTNPMDGHLRQMGYETNLRAKIFVMPFIRLFTWLLRRSSFARRLLIDIQQKFFTSNIYDDLFDKYQPVMTISSTPGWRWDRFLLRESAARGITNTAVIVGWDNPSSYRLPGAHMDYITCWSDIQKEELVLGSDWSPDQVNIGGIPSYDGYFLKTWQMSREEYFKLHGLDPDRKLLSYACSFVTFSPNFANISALVELVNSSELDEPCQLLIRLHPNHFMPGSLYEVEANKVRELIKDMPHVHLVEPVPLGGELGYYSGEDMPEKSSMMAHSDIFLTVYSTMVVETAIHDRPIVSVCIDVPGGWNTPGKFSLKLTEIAEWPTHLRFREAGAGRVAFDKDALREHINTYLRDPASDAEMRRQFILDECTHTDGSASRRTGAYLASLLKKNTR